MSFDTTLFVRDVEGSLVALNYDTYGEPFATFRLRDAHSTATASLTNGTVTSLQAAVTGRYMDLKQITFANNSGAAVSINLLDDSTIAETFQVPASNTLVVNFDSPLPQGALGSIWQLDMPDITGTTVTVFALFRRNRP